MVRIVAKLQLKEGTKEKFIQLAKELIVKSQEEEGCIDYNLFQSQSMLACRQKHTRKVLYPVSPIIFYGTNILA